MTGLMTAFLGKISLYLTIFAHLGALEAGPNYIFIMSNKRERTSVIIALNKPHRKEKKSHAFKTTRGRYESPRSKRIKRIKILIRFSSVWMIEPRFFKVAFSHIIYPTGLYLFDSLCLMGRRSRPATWLCGLVKGLEILLLYSKGYIEIYIISRERSKFSLRRILLSFIHPFYIYIYTHDPRVLLTSNQNLTPFTSIYIHNPQAFLNIPHFRSYHPYIFTQSLQLPPFLHHHAFDHLLSARLKRDRRVQSQASRPAG